MMRQYCVLPVASVLLAACAAPSPGQPAMAQANGQGCFRAADVRNYRYVSPDKVNLRVGLNDVYQVTTLGNCRDINFSEAIGIESGGGSDWICNGLNVTLVAPSPIGPRRCPATDLRRLTPEEAAALPSGQRP